MRNFTSDYPHRRAEKPQKHVALLIETSNEYARGLLAGVKSYIRTHRPWAIYLGEHSRLGTDLSWLHNWRGDGILARIENTDIADYVRQLNVPTVDLSALRLIPSLPCVETDDEAIAGLAANHLVGRGLKHFAYCGNPSFPWSVERERHFERMIREKGYPVHRFVHEPKSTVMEERTAMARWLERLPKPIGIMACYDVMAQSLLEACRLADVPVPDQAAILGVDNDDLLCNLSSPPLSSIKTDTMKTGYMAASLLDRMMSGERIEPQVWSIPPLEVVTRLSTDVVAVDDPYVSAAIQYIREHAYEDLKVEDVLRSIPLSRRALDHRFVQALDRTPHEEIVEVRMRLLMRLLTETDWTLAVIAERLSFKHSEYMGVAFKKYTGLSPGAYREKHSAMK